MKEITASYAQKSVVPAPSTSKVEKNESYMSSQQTNETNQYVQVPLSYILAAQPLLSFMVKNYIALSDYYLNVSIIDLYFQNNLALSQSGNQSMKHAVPVSNENILHNFCQVDLDCNNKNDISTTSTLNEVAGISSEACDLKSQKTLVKKKSKRGKTCLITSEEYLKELTEQKAKNIKKEKIEEVLNEDTKKSKPASCKRKFIPKNEVENPCPVKKSSYDDVIDLVATGDSVIDITSLPTIFSSQEIANDQTLN